MNKRLNQLQKISMATLIINFLLCAAKISVGIFTYSTAMISDGVDSLTDLGTSAAVLIGIKMSREESDKLHPYGHERIEFVVSLLVSFILVTTALFIGINAVKNLILGGKTVKMVGLGIAVSVCSIVVKEIMYHISSAAAKKYKSDAMKADALHQRVDALSSVVVLIGLISVMLWDFHQAEFIAAILVVALILFNAIKILISSSKQLIDSSAGEEIENKIRERAMRCTEIIGIETLKTRQFGSKLYVDIDILVDERMTLAQAHDVSHKIHDMIEAEFNAKHVQVHFSPSKL